MNLKWSARSQASYQREAKLRDQLSEVQRRIGYDQRILSDAQRELDRLMNSASLGSSAASEGVPETLERIARQKAVIEAFEGQRTKIQAQIDAVGAVSPAEAKERLANQTALAKLAVERLKVDRTLASTVQMVRNLLEKRSGITDGMLGLMRRIDFTLAFDGLDKDRFDALEKSLSADVEGKSEAWVGWLFGENQKTERYTVRNETVTFAETLVNPNVYGRGEQCDLTPEELAEISATEESSVAYPSEAIPGGGFRAGSRVEIREPRVEKVAKVGE